MVAKNSVAHLYSLLIVRPDLLLLLGREFNRLEAAQVLPQHLIHHNSHILITLSNGLLNQVKYVLQVARDGFHYIGV